MTDLEPSSDWRTWSATVPPPASEQSAASSLLQTSSSLYSKFEKSSSPFSRFFSLFLLLFRKTLCGRFGKNPRACKRFSPIPYAARFDGHWPRFRAYHSVCSCPHHHAYHFICRPFQAIFSAHFHQFAQSVCRNFISFTFRLSLRARCFSALKHFHGINKATVAGGFMRQEPVLQSVTACSHVVRIPSAMSNECRRVSRAARNPGPRALQREPAASRGFPRERVRG